MRPLSQINTRFGFNQGPSFLIAASVLAMLVGRTRCLTCFLCEGNALTCENLVGIQYCTGPEIYCRLDVSSVTYPYIKQSCAATCVETVAQDGSTYTYCTRRNYGNCYRKQCNRLLYGSASRTKPLHYLMMASSLLFVSISIITCGYYLTI